MVKKFILLSTCLLMLSLCLAQPTNPSKPANTNLEKPSKKTKGVEVWNCSNINTDATDCFPAFYENGIVFASARQKEGKIDENTGETFYELYYAESDRNFIPMKPVKYSLEANSAYHEGGVSYNRKGNIMFFSSNNQKYGFSIANKKGDVNMKIYQAKRGLRDWEEIYPLPFNSDKYTCFHPSLSADGRTLYFASNMIGGYGGYDLYSAEKKGNTWSKPLNLGAKINTAADEAFPFIHDSGVLFFASQGHPTTHGGKDFDLHRIDMSKMGAAVKNLGEPYNSPMDDLALTLNSDGDIGYFASSRDGGFGKDDIYMFKTDNRLTTETFTLNGLLTVKDEASNVRIPNAAIRIFEKTMNGFLNGDQFYNVEMSESGKDKGIKLVRKQAEQLGKPDRFSTDNGEAKYDMQNDREYLIVVTKEGYEAKEFVYSTFEKMTGTNFIEVPMRKLLSPKLLGKVVSTQNNNVANALVKVLNLTTNKVAQTLTNANGVFDLALETNNDYEITAEAKGYQSSSVEKISIGNDINNNNCKVILTAIEPVVESKPMATGTVIVLEKIYYDFDKAIIRQGAAEELDALVSLLQRYTSMEVELVSHTDARGKAEYNQKLSTARAIAAKNYLTARGIADYRVAALGAGESQLRNRCEDGKNCNEEEHQYNRRTEVRITKMNEETVKVQYGDKGPEVINGKNE